MAMQWCAEVCKGSAWPCVTFESCALVCGEEVHQLGVLKVHICIRQVVGIVVFLTGCSPPLLADLVLPLLPLLVAPDLFFLVACFVGLFFIVIVVVIVIIVVIVVVIIMVIIIIIIVIVIAIVIIVVTALLIVVALQVSQKSRRSELHLNTRMRP